MINNKNNWYSEAREASLIVQEAGITDNWKTLVFAVALVLSGLSLIDVSEKTGLPPEQIQQALNNKEIVEQAQNQEESSMPRLDFSGIEELIRQHEVSGAERYVRVKGKNVDIRKAYPDPIHGWKVPTIGVGYNLNKPEARGEIEALGLDYDKVRKGEQALTDEQVNILYRDDIAKAILSARRFLPNFDQQPTEVKTVIVDMAFNLGETRLRKFKKFRKALENNNYQEAAEEMKNSRWYHQVGNRAKRNVEKMLEFHSK